MPRSSPADIMRFFDYDHLPEGRLRDTSHRFHQLAWEMFNTLEGSAEKFAGMRKLLEAKDCMVRAALPKDHSASS